jgi:hypothetical protein
MKPTKLWGLAVALVCLGSPGWSLGQAEDPLEVQTKSWGWDKVTSLEINGEVEFTIVKGDAPRVTVTTTRALFDQLSVSNWWGAAGIVVESGLKGPREQGKVKVVVELPNLGNLTVADHSSGTVAWPGEPGEKPRKLVVKDQSAVTVDVAGGTLDVETTWFSTVVLKGTADGLDAQVRRQSRLDARNLALGIAHLLLNEKSTYAVGPTDRGTARVRNGSRIEGDAGAPWTVQEDPAESN